MATTIPELHPEQLLTTQQVAALTGISKFTFERWRSRKDGGPKVVNLGPQIVRYRWCELREWMDSRTAATA